jgi:hypothetical protein
MYLGTRRIRSAGRTSGSIEITLPAQLQILEGVECRLMVRDGSRPEIVLQPDLSAAQSLFHTLWQKLRLGLGEIDEIGDFSPADFTLAFFPPRHWQERPPLAYADALTVLRTFTPTPPTPLPLSRPFGLAQGKRREKGKGAKGGGGEGEVALARLLAFLTVAASYRLGLNGALALAFGDAVAYLITGSSAGLGTDFERGMAHRTFWGEGRAQQPLGSPFDDQVWQQARTGFRRVYEQFHAWQENPETYAAAREKWYRALTVEMGVQTLSVEEYVGR